MGGSTQNVPKPPTWKNVQKSQGQIFQESQGQIFQESQGQIFQECQGQIPRSNPKVKNFRNAKVKSQGQECQGQECLECVECLECAEWEI